jgi:hypothetical protein
MPLTRMKHLAEAEARITLFYEAWGKLDKAAEWKTKLTSSSK